MPLFNAVQGVSIPKATYDNNGTKTLVKALTIDKTVSPIAYTYNGDTLYINPYTEIVNYDTLLTNIESNALV